MRHLNIDIETFSSVDLKKAGLYKYVQSPDFQILLFAYSLDGEPVQIVDLTQGEQIPQEILRALWDYTIVKHAYNAPFEWYCLSKYFGLQNEDITNWLYQWQCTMLHGLYCGYTAGLAATAVALGLPDDRRKMGIGKALIKTFCVPCKPTSKNGNRIRTLPHHEPEKWNLFKQYCIQDVVTEMEIERRLSNFPVPEQEQRLWQLDQQINSYGVAVDKKLIEGALYCSEIITNELMQEAISISGLDNPKSVKQLSKWVEDETGEEITDLQKGTVNTLISTLDNDKAVRMLELRQELSKTSVKKYAAMDSAVCDDGRIRGLLQFYGANRTGRWAGRLVQVQNLPRNYIDTLSIARQLVKDKKIDALKLIYGNVPDILSQLIRTAFIPSENNIFISADFSAIEARVIAWLAGEKWKMDVFATHGKIYEASASQMFGVPIDRIVKGNPEYELRQRGKVAELGLGYSMGASKFKDTAERNYNIIFTEEEAKDIVYRWRSSNKRIVDLWYSLEAAALSVMRTGQPVGIKGLIFAREGDYQNGQDFLTITLPSGRKLFYAKPFLSSNQWGNDSLHYYESIAKQWTTSDTYGGKLTENVVQAIARDCLAVSLERLAQTGYQTVFHIHDEAIIDRHLATDKETEIESIAEIMGQPISWAPGLLLKADGFSTEYYKKD